MVTAHTMRTMSHPLRTLTTAAPSFSTSNSAVSAFSEGVFIDNCIISVTCEIVFSDNCIISATCEGVFIDNCIIRAFSEIVFSDNNVTSATCEGVSTDNSAGTIAFTDVINSTFALHPDIAHRAGTCTHATPDAAAIGCKLLVAD